MSTTVTITDDITGEVITGTYYKVLIRLSNANPDQPQIAKDIVGFNKVMQFVDSVRTDPNTGTITRLEVQRMRG